MSVSSNKSKRRGLFGSLVNRRQEMEVTDQWVGDIHADEPVFIAANATVAGDIYAPVVRVAGMVYGFVITLEATVEPNGQVWGDLYATTLDIKELGRVNGWVSTITPLTYQALHHAKKHGRPALDEAVVDEEETLNTLPDEVQQAVYAASNAMPSERVNILRELQSQTAAALLAREEVERAFDERVQEVAGDTLLEVERLKKQVAEIENEKSGLQTHIEGLEGQLEERDEEIKKVQHQLLVTNTDLSTAQTTFTDLEAIHEQQLQERLQVEQRLAQSETDLQGKVQEIEQQAERIVNLETALQASLQRTTEQEEALLRWQELSELNESKAEASTTQAEKLQAQFNAQVELVTNLTNQLESQEQAVQTARQEIERLQAEVGKLDSIVAELEPFKDQATELGEKLALKTKDLGLTKEALAEATAALAEARQKVSLLEGEVADLETTAVALAEADTQIKALTAARDGAIATIEEARSDVAQAQAEVARIQATRNDQLIQLEDELRDLQTQLAGRKSELAELQAAKEEVGLRITAYEDEIDTFTHSITEQRNRLAELQAALSERDVMVARLKAFARQQAEDIEKIKQVATAKIQGLQQTVTQQAAQLEDLTIVLKRRQKRDPDPAEE